MKFFGVIGYGIPQEDSYGVVTNRHVEHMHYGDATKVVSRNEPAQQVNDNIRLVNSFSIVMDAFITENFQYIKYIVFLGVKWAVTSAQKDPDRPRIIIEAGKVYNGTWGGGENDPQAETAH